MEYSIFGGEARKWNSSEILLLALCRFVSMDSSFIKKLATAHQECTGCPSPEVVSRWFKDMLAVLFPDFSNQPLTTPKLVELELKRLRHQLYSIFYQNHVVESEQAETLADRFFDGLPAVHALLEGDVEAVFQGDPAAKSKSEVIRTYPGFFAIAAYRIAHALWTMGIRIFPRIITEHAHSVTGIDIHPGAQIGPSFCIDHGTGVVIGETTVIGTHVKIYQGVTLGALSVRKADAETKRHPTIEDRVVIYAGATILGGETVIGHGAVVGGNVWLTHSIAPGTKVYYKAKMTNRETGDSDEYTFVNQVQ